MLRLAELENRELKDSLRYVEVQLAKTKDNLRTTGKNYESALADAASCREQISR